MSACHKYKYLFSFAVGNCVSNSSPTMTVIPSRLWLLTPYTCRQPMSFAHRIPVHSPCLSHTVHLYTAHVLRTPYTAHVPVHLYTAHVLRTLYTAHVPVHLYAAHVLCTQYTCTQPMSFAPHTPVHSPCPSHPVHSPCPSTPVHSPCPSTPVHSPCPSHPIHLYTAHVLRTPYTAHVPVHLYTTHVLRTPYTVPVYVSTTTIGWTITVI